MPGRILIVDDNVTRRITMAARLSGAFYDIEIAGSDAEAIAIMGKWQPGVILVADELSCIPAERFIAMLRHDPRHEQVTIFAVTAPGAQIGRSGLLSAGADDVIPRSEPEEVFKARLRSHERAKEVLSTLELRGDARQLPGLSDGMPLLLGQTRVILAAPDPSRGDRWKDALSRFERFKVRSCALSELPSLASDLSDGGLVVIGMDPGTEHVVFRLLAEMRRRRDQADTEILLFAPNAAPGIMAESYEIGAASVMTGPFDADEVTARLKALQIRLTRRRMLKRALSDGMRASVTDPLTGLHNRRFALPRLTQIARNPSQYGRGFAILLADIDHFKAVNDKYGHSAGDQALKAVAHALRDRLDADDLLARIGGEEFLMVLTDLNETEALDRADLLCSCIRETDIRLAGKETPVRLTISIGIATETASARPGDALIAEADAALYTAKRQGRDQAVLFSENQSTEPRNLQHSLRVKP